MEDGVLTLGDVAKRHRSASSPHLVQLIEADITADGVQGRGELLGPFGISVALAEFTARETPRQRALIDDVRGLIDHITITPVTQDRRWPVAITLHGDLSRFLKDPNEEGTADPTKWGTAGSWGQLQAWQTVAEPRGAARMHGRLAVCFSRWVRAQDL